MKTFIKLLLLAAVALPAWLTTAAQTDVSGQEVVPSSERAEVTTVNKVGWQELFQDKSPDLAKAAHSVQTTQPVAKVQTTASSADKKPVTNGHARKAPATMQSAGKHSAPAMAPRGAAKAPPASATIKEWQIQTDWYDKAAGTSSSETGWVLGSFGRTTVNVAITSTTVYIQGLSKYFPDAWVEGTLSSNANTTTTSQFYGMYKVTFNSGQLYGTENGESHYFVGEWDGAYDSAVWFWYDKTNEVLYQHIQYEDETGNPIYNYICEGTTATDINGYGYHEGTVLTKIVNREMKTLSEDEIRALVNTEDGDMFHYKYPINVSNPTKEGTLLDHVVVTDEESAGHAIALLRAVYTNQYLPGPYYRGFTSSNVEEGSVDYSAVGSVTASGVRWSSNGNYYTGTLTGVEYANTAGWNIEPLNAISTGMSPYNNFTFEGDSYSYTQRCQYATFDPTDYRPNEEGYTLLLVEVQDNFKTSDVYDATNKRYRTFSTDPYENLVQYVLKTIKSVRLITEAKRTGTNVWQGTLFKIDANKLNRFFIISKGQARKFNNSYYATYTNQDFCEAPYYGLYKLSSSSYNSTYGLTYVDNSSKPIFYHMFEQFSPSAANQGAAKSDIYKTLVTGLDATGTDKTGFPVYHDCVTVPYAEAEEIDETTGEGSGHEFKMLGASDPITSAPDVRDLLFFVPDHRLTYHSNTTFPDGKTYSRDYALFDNDNTIIQSYIYYNQNYAPRMDMYVIHLNPIEGKQVKNEQTGMYEHVYQLELNWKSNMSSFLPATEQCFTLWRKVTDADGSSEYQQVYHVNEMGLYVDANGEVLEDQNNESLRVPVEMQGVYSLNELDYFDYVPMDAIGKEVTYYVQGRDVGKFLSLQSSNEESYLIPGYDKNVRLTLKINTDNYSKFDMPNQKNNYWNEIAVANNMGTSVTANFLDEGTIIDFSRRDLNISNADSVIVARATVQRKTNSTITVKMDYYGQVNFTGSKYNDNLSSFTFTYPAAQSEGVVDFGDWKFYDNFQANVSNNEHPSRYVYRAFFHAAEKFLLDDNVTQSNLVYSNVRGFKVFKTEPNVNSTFTLQEVLDDSNMSVELKDNSVYKIEVERSPLSELWRYEVCRWAENTTQDTFTYFGDAQNQSNEDHYSLSFDYGLPQYYNDVNAPMTPGVNTATVEFEDRDLKANGGAYNYVPQVVVYTKRSDNNTYGAPRKTTAVGKLEVEVYTPTDVEVHGNDNQEGDPTLAQMSDYSWFANEKWYSYYNIYLKFTALNVPEGYELYKVRAWRKVDGSILGEEIGTRSGRIPVDANKEPITDWYMYEDINYDDYLGAQKTAQGELVDRYMSKSEISGGYLLGHRSTYISKPLNPDGTGGGAVFAEDGTWNENEQATVESLVDNEMRATFGALRLKDVPPYPGTLDKLNASFKVRAYFTKNGNPLITNPPTPSEDGQKLRDVSPYDFDYYIAEGEIDNIEIKSQGIITGINGVKMDVNREVVSVSYVNTVGQVSSTPWQGINMVVTRYSDGSTTTKKVIR